MSFCRKFYAELVQGEFHDLDQVDPYNLQKADECQALLRAWEGQFAPVDYSSVSDKTIRRSEIMNNVRNFERGMGDSPGHPRLAGFSRFDGADPAVTPAPENNTNAAELDLVARPQMQPGMRKGWTPPRLTM